MIPRISLSRLSMVFVSYCLLACETFCASASLGPEDLHRAVVRMQEVRESLHGRLGAVTDSIERSRRIREVVDESVAQVIGLGLCAEVAAISLEYLAVSSPGSDEENYYEFVYTEIVRRLARDDSIDARSELLQIRSSVRVDGGIALVLYEAFEMQEMKW
jgi:hypothetical protein